MRPGGDAAFGQHNQSGTAQGHYVQRAAAGQCLGAQHGGGEDDLRQGRVKPGLRQELNLEGDAMRPWRASQQGLQIGPTHRLRLAKHDGIEPQPQPKLRHRLFQQRGTLGRAAGGHDGAQRTGKVMRQPRAQQLRELRAAQGEFMGHTPISFCAPCRFGLTGRNFTMSVYLSCALSSSVERRR